MFSPARPRLEVSESSLGPTGGSVAVRSVGRSSSDDSQVELGELGLDMRLMVLEQGEPLIFVAWALANQRREGAQVRQRHSQGP